jgi:osomolarity two-component system phosphorelay intermediate protein YPD1
LGIIKVQAICEKIQHYGHKHDEDQQKIEEEDALKRIASLLKECKKDYVVAKAWLVNLYESGE